MKKIFFLVVILTLSLLCRAQERKYSTFYYQRATLFEELPVTSSDIIFLGNSITNGAEWAELFKNKHVKNRGISGDICMGVYDRLDAILKGKPAKIFLLIGINDVSRGTTADTIVSRIEMIVRKIKADSPKQSYICKVFFRSPTITICSRDILPVGRLSLKSIKG